MSEPTPQGDPTPQDSTASQPAAGDPKPSGDPSPNDWEAKFEGQRKVNRDLERKLDEARKAADRVSALEEQLAKLQGKEQEFEAAQHQRQLEAEALAKANDRIRKAEVRAAAAGKLADPSDALRYLDLEQFEVDADGGVDSASVLEAIESLIKDKPYLAAQGGTTQAFTSPTSRREGGDKGQVTRAELERMTIEQVNAARREGRLNDLLGIK